MEPDEDEFLFFQYAEDDEGASTLTNMDDEPVIEDVARLPAGHPYKVTNG